MRTLFDTSTLVAALLEDHPQHIFCLSWLEKVHNATTLGFVSTHTLAELYSVLTRLPRIPKLQPREVNALLGNLQILEKIVLEPQDYEAAIHRLVNLQLTGGIVFDALIAQAALKAGASRLLTLNAKDFLRLGAEVAPLVVSPG
ncbi:MAG: type II toxin-antitoxin system VapC family toxin [Synechococcales cyanobacterium CRU_2_2]|nr:type II toxin-antitoxin system VapC family toxin [Synechococcales cyanobacterium CRU_2_2]